jgi:hypothetical protein
MRLDAAATADRTKNARDGFEFCIQIHSPNAATGACVAGALQPKVKRWTKLVMALSCELDMTAWLRAIRWGVQSTAARSRQHFNLL